jgi:hypothetical protein
MAQKVPLPSRTNGCTRKLLTFRDLIAAVYERCGKAHANGLLRLAVNARLVVFLGQQRFMTAARSLPILSATSAKPQRLQLQRKEAMRQRLLWSADEGRMFCTRKYLCTVHFA